MEEVKKESPKLISKNRYNRWEHSMSKNFYKQDLDIHQGQYNMYFKRRFTILYNLNDVFIGLLFLTGSICSLWRSTETLSGWLFISGSVLLITKPLIRIYHRLQFHKEIAKSQDGNNK